MQNESSTDVSVREIMDINIQHEGPQFNHLSEHLTNPTWKKRIKELTQNYVPAGIEDCEVKMKIMLVDESPVFLNPRRLSAEQKK